MTILRTTSFALLAAVAVLFVLDAASAKPRSLITKYSQLTKQQQDGLDACYAWCNEHNKTQNSQADCGNNCWDYWSHHQG